MRSPMPSCLRLCSLSVLLLLGSCADNPSAASAPTPVPTSVPSIQPVISAPAPAAAAIVSVSFESWLATFRARALAAGVEAGLFDRVFANLEPDPSIIEADRSQPEFSRPVWEYLDGALSATRVRKGQALLSEHRALLDRIERQYGVDRAALVAVWGMESNFGQFMGSKSVIRSLATLAHEGRRPAFAEEQLLAALQILGHGDIQPAGMLGSWAGAMGQTQFIPTTYNTHAVDFDGDGRRDIWNSSADALASAAHYLQASGWQAGQPWGFEVTLPQGFDYALADPALRKPLREWQALGVNTGRVDARLLDQSAALLLPAGHRGPAFVTLPNFRAILKYNNSSSYALAIGLLGERFAGGGQIAASWPRNDLPLSRSERIELQEALAARGYQPGAADSIIGANTRNAIRAFQKDQGLPADGYPTTALLKKLRED
jgi:membrane-bound lytic murein transglycosylase B